MYVIVSIINDEKKKMHGITINSLNFEPIYHVSCEKEDIGGEFRKVKMLLREFDVSFKVDYSSSLAQGE